MIDRLITLALERRLVVGLFVAFLLGGGVWAVSSLPVEAFPDLTANAVTIIAEAPGMAAQDVEQQVTFPIERSLLGLPRTQEVRSTTKFGLSITQVIFDDGVDAYFARQLVAERLGAVAAVLPPGVDAELGPISTAMGEVYQYVLVSDSERWDPTALKTLHDYTIAPQLRTVAGVAEVNSWGGFTEQYHVTVDPDRLARAGLTLAEVEDALARNNRNFGGAYTEDRGERFVVRGVGRLQGLEDIRNVQVATRGGVPLLIADLATVSSGALPRQGAVTYNGEGEVVSGMVIMRKGENARRVIAATEARVEEVRRGLPAGVRLVPFYEQTDLVDRTTATVRKNLLLGATLVVILLWLFLRNIAASLIVAVVIPLSMLWAFIAMRWFGYSANLMSLGALDFGLLVDASVVMVENIMRRSEEEEGVGVTARIRDAALEVGRPVVFGIAIIVAVYLPIFALEGTERRMFVPMAFTVTVAILGSLLLALTFVPAAARIFLRDAREVHMPGFERFKGGYRRLLTRILPRPLPVLTGAGVLVLVAVLSAGRLGTEFMPRLDEGSVLVQTMRLPSTALDQGVEFSLALERALLGLPEVETVVSKLGRPDLATEAMGTYESDTYVMLREKREWRRGGKDALLAAMDSALRTVPGVGFAFTQPIQMRLDEAETGITTDVGVKIFGSDPERLASLADRVERVVARVPGAADVKVTAASLVNEVSLVLEREALARYGLDSESVGRQIELALGSAVATQVIDGARRIDVVVRVPEASAIDPDLLGALPVATAAGGLVPLGAVTRIERVRTPEAFVHEGGQRMVVVGANIRGRDVGSFVADASRSIQEQVRLPEGYHVEWGGQYQHQQTALRRLSFLVPLAIGIIFLLLFAAFGNVRHSALILVNVPFALVGGIAALWIGGLNLSTSAIIGFIAVFGIAVLNGVVMVSYVNRLREEGQALRNAVLEGAATRLRPVLMTAAAAILGFIPMALSTSPGAELQRPLATVVIGGLVTATALTLLVLPLLYYLMERSIDRQDHFLVRFTRVRPFPRGSRAVVAHRHGPA
jgi:heavy metal efflux system protein